MPSSTSIILVLALASTVVPTLAFPVYGSYSYDIAKREEEIARNLEYILARADESGAINFKKLGQRIASGARTVAKYAKAAAPYALQAASLLAREDQELFARLDARDQEYVLREILEARGRKWDEVKKVTGEVGHGIIDTANAIAPLVADGAQIVQSFSKEHISREDAAYELVARAFYDLD